MGKGLLRLFFAFWLIWIAVGIADSYKELATYIGYDRWTVEKALERQKIKCDKTQAIIDCVPFGSVLVDEVVQDADVKRKVSDFVDLILIVPLILLLCLLLLYMLGKWVVNGFKKN